jgi:hypothetical protein
MSIATNGTSHKIECSWDDLMAGTLPETPVQRHFRAAVLEVAARARAALPESHGRIERAVALVLDGQVTLLEDGKSARVNSQSTPDKYYVANGDCGCVDVDHAPSRLCKHRLSYGIMKRATVIARERAAREAAAHPVDPFAPEPVADIPARFIVELHGKQFVTYNGLLALAHERGLMSLKAAFVTVTADLATAHAVATFKDGRTFEESGDATPGNVNAKIKPHFPRMALTRSKARCLRDALNISLCSVEELEN